MKEAIMVPRLFDTHVHLREASDENVMRALIEHSISGGASAIAFMPNTKSGLKTAKQVTTYLDNTRRLADEISSGNSVIQIIPIAMLTEDTTEVMIDDWVFGGIKDCKVYPRFRTNQSQDGVRAYSKVMDLIAYCGKVGVRVHLHPENPNMGYGNRDAEYAFLPIMEMLMEQAPDTVFVWEHGTDRRCIPFWEEWAKTGCFYVTITAHHLLTNEDKSYGDVRSVCKPNPKEEADRLALIQLITEGYSWVMAGTDTAFHDTSAKHPEIGCCACGAFTATHALEMYAHALSRLLVGVDFKDSPLFENFVSLNARRLYCDIVDSSNEKLNDYVELEYGEWEIPKTYDVGGQTALPFMAGENLKWRIVKK